MVTKNFKNLLSLALESCATVYSVAPMTDVNCTYFFASAQFSQFPNARTAAVTLTDSAAGISIGSGNKEADEEDYQLESPITEGCTLALQSTTPGADEHGIPFVKYLITITNTGNEELVVNEIGYKQTVLGNKRPNMDSNSNFVVMIDRSVLSSPLRINAGESATIHYTLKTDAYPTPRQVAGIDMVSFTYGTDEQIAAIIDAARDGIIDLQEDAKWRVGQCRVVEVGAWTGYNSKSHPAADHLIAITEFGDYSEPCGALFQFDFIGGCPVDESMGTPTQGYKNSNMKSVGIPAFVEALPAWLKNRLKTFSVECSTGGTSSVTEIVTNNLLALRSARELGNTNGTIAVNEGEPIQYYQNEQNRIKYKGAQGSAMACFTRTPTKNNTNYWLAVNTGGKIGTTGTGTFYMAPFGCI